MTTDEFVGILKKIQKGDSQAAEKLYNEYFPKIYISIWQILKDRKIYVKSVIKLGGAIVDLGGD